MRAANRLQERLVPPPSLRSTFGRSQGETSPLSPLTSNKSLTSHLSPLTSENDNVIFLKTDYRIVKVTISDIRYVEAMSEYLKVWLEGEAKPLITLLSMKKMEERLPATFMRIHRSYIINLDKIQEVNKSRVIMDADTYLPIGDLYKEAFQQYVDTKFLGK
jgi:DNA-binding LytR/AlgR family response regulator